MTRTRVLPVMVLAVATFVVAGSSARADARGARSPCPHATKSKAITLQDADAGKTVCAGRGVMISVYLHAPANQDGWQPILASNGQVLVSKPSGRLALPVGVTGAVYEVAGRGRASLRSSRPPCSPPARAGCDAAHSWTAHVVAR